MISEKELSEHMKGDPVLAVLGQEQILTAEESNKIKQIIKKAYVRVFSKTKQKAYA